MFVSWPPARTARALARDRRAAVPGPARRHAYACRSAPGPTGIRPSRRAGRQLRRRLRPMERTVLWTAPMLYAVLADRAMVIVLRLIVSDATVTPIPRRDDGTTL